MQESHVFRNGEYYWKFSLLKKLHRRMQWKWEFSVSRPTAAAHIHRATQILDQRLLDRE